MVGGQGAGSGYTSRQQERDASQQPDPGPTLSATKSTPPGTSLAPRGFQVSGGNKCGNKQQILAEVE